MEAAQLPRSLDSLDLAVINGNYAIQAGLKVADALAIESADGPRAPPTSTCCLWPRAGRRTRHPGSGGRSGVRRGQDLHRGRRRGAGWSCLSRSTGDDRRRVREAAMEGRSGPKKGAKLA